MTVSLFLTSGRNKMARTGLISSTFIVMFDFAVFCSSVLVVNQAFPLAAFVFALQSCRFLFYFLYFYA